MFDPAVMGTLLIGLDAIRADARPDLRPRPITSSRRARGGVRVALAQGLRLVAAMLDRPAVGEQSG